METTRLLRKTLRGYRCIYCGLTADNLDHFPPQSLTNLGWLLPACRECNTLAGTAWSFDWEARCRFVKTRLREKYRKELGTPEWADDEINTLGKNLKSKVTPWRERQKLIRERLAWNVESYLLLIDHTNDFAKWLAEIASTTGNEKTTWRDTVVEEKNGQLRFNF
jgi:hypothetical protein